MARLPIPGSDNGDWGNILNSFLEISHNSDGTLANNTVGTNQIQNNAVTSAQLDTPTQTVITSITNKYEKPSSGIPSSDLASNVQTSLTAASSAIQSVNNKTGTSITLAASDINAIPSAYMGAASGVATLDNTSKLSIAQVPSSVINANSIAANTLPVASGSGSVNWQTVGTKTRYLILLSGSEAVALNTQTWNADYQDTNHYNVFQEAINQIASVGGAVEFRDVFNLSSGAATLQIPSGVGLIGPGPLSSFNSYTPQAGMLISSYNGPIIEMITNPSGLLSFPYLSGFTIQGGGPTKTSQVGVQVASGSYDAYIDEVLIFQAGQYGFQALGGKNWLDKCYIEDCGVAGADIAGGTTNRITNSYIFGNGTNGVTITAGTYFGMNGCFLCENGVGNSGADVSITSSATSGEIVGNMFEQFAGASNSPTTLKIASTNPEADWLIANNTGLNTRMGKLATPFSTEFSNVATFGPGGTLAAPQTPTTTAYNYKVQYTPLWVSITGGTAVSITITDFNGSTLASGLTSYTGRLEVGQWLSFGLFTAPPTVVAAVV